VIEKERRREELKFAIQIFMGKNFFIQQESQQKGHLQVSSFSRTV